MRYIGWLNNIFFGDERTKRLSKNILYSFFIKGYAMVIQFALIPITLGYLDKFYFGIWLILASIIEWFSYFDIGIGHGLRNRLAEALANDDNKLAKIYTSTAYGLVTIIFAVFIFIFMIINQFLDWATILNAPASEGEQLREIVRLVFVFFSIRFVLSLITPVIFANQDSALNSFMGPLGSTFSLITIIVLFNFVPGSLFWISIIFSATPLIIMALFTVVLYKTRYRNIAPGIRYIDFSYSKKLLGLGIGFFIIQVSMLILFSSSNIILNQLYGPEEVTVYNVAHKYFTIAIMISVIITMPYWSSFTEAYLKNDVAWIKTSIKKLNYISLLLVGGLLVSLIFADQLIYLWVGSAITIPTSMKFALTVYVSIYLLSVPYNIFINGISKIRLQLYMAVVSIFITIPLAILFSKTLNIGPAGVVIAMICSTLPGGILWRIQYHKLIHGKAEGVWNK